MALRSAVTSQLLEAIKATARQVVEVVEFVVKVNKIKAIDSRKLSIFSLRSFGILLSIQSIRPAPGLFIAPEPYRPVPAT